jgi:hypothetical protein
MKTYAQIAKAMYGAYSLEEASLRYPGMTIVDGTIAKWEDENPCVHDNWIAAAKEAAKQFDVKMVEDHKGTGNDN